MSDVIDLKTRPPKIWVCKCGCTTFEINEHDTASCANCWEVTSGPETGNWIPDPNVTDKNAFTSVQGNGSVEFAKERIRRMAFDEDAAIIVVVKKSGRLSTWTACEETPEHISWIRRKMREVTKLLTTAMGVANGT